MTIFQPVVEWVLGSVVGCLERRDCDQNGCGLKPTRAILWKRHFPTHFPCIVVLANSSDFQSCPFNYRFS